MEYTVYSRKAPKSVSSTLHAKTPYDAVKFASEVLNLPIARLAVCDYGKYEDYMIGMITRDQLVLSSLHFRY